MTNPLRYNKIGDPLMYEYNLFLIKREYYDLYQNKPDFLFTILNDLRKMNDDLSYGVTLYEQLCQKIDIDTLQNYFNVKFKLENYRLFYIQKSSILLQYSRVTVKSFQKYPSILRLFYCYNHYLLVCDFIHNECFWLSDFMKAKPLNV